MADIKRFYTVGGGNDKYEYNYGKIKWSEEVEIKEFEKKEESEFEKWIYKASRNNTHGYTEQLIKEAWDYQQKRISELEKVLKFYADIRNQNIKLSEFSSSEALQDLFELVESKASKALKNKEQE